MSEYENELKMGCGVPNCPEFDKETCRYGEGTCGSYVNICQSCVRLGWISRYGKGSQGLYNEKLGLKTFHTGEEPWPIVPIDSALKSKIKKILSK